MTTSEQIDQIAAALVKAQGELKNAPFNATNPHLKNKFANLVSVRDTVVPTLSKHGIAVTQALMPLDGRAAVATRLLHVSGQWLESLCPLPDVGDMQKLGSAITYARRYSLSAICGIAADEDDDANAASEPKAAATAPKGYEPWIKTLDAYAANHTEQELIAEIADSGEEEWKAHLRGDTATLTALRTKARKNKGKAA